MRCFRVLVSLCCFCACCCQAVVIFFDGMYPWQGWVIGGCTGGCSTDNVNVVAVNDACPSGDAYCLLVAIHQATKTDDFYYFYRVIPTVGYFGITVQFSFTICGTGGTLHVDYSLDGGLSYTQFYSSSALPTSGQTITLGMPAAASYLSTFMVRFRCRASSTSIFLKGCFLIDNVYVFGNTPAPTRKPSASPTPTPTLSPTLEPSIEPTLHPSVEPTYDPSMEPSAYPTLEPTMKMVKEPPPKSHTDTSIVNLAIVIAVGVFSGLLIPATVMYLVFITYNSRVRYIWGQGSLRIVCKAMSKMERVSPVLELIDIATDFLYAIDLILSSDGKTEAAIYWLAWISFIIGCIGGVLFIVKLLLIRKLYFIFPQLRSRQKEIHDASKVEHQCITKIIRRRQRDVICFDLLIGAVEDVPQFGIITMFAIHERFTIISLITLASSIALLFWKIIRVLLNICGLFDDQVTEDEYITVIDELLVQEKKNGSPKKIDQIEDIDHNNGDGDNVNIDKSEMQSFKTLAQKYEQN